jgi:hypothetical protein
LYPIPRRFQQIPRPLLVYVLVLALCAGSAALGLLLAGFGLGNLWVIAALACIAVVAERGCVRLTTTIEESISLLPTLFAAVLFGPLASMLVSAASMIGDLRRVEGVPMPYMKWAIYTSSRSLTGAATGLVALAVSHSTGSRLGAIAIATSAGALTAQLLDGFFAALTLRVRGRGSMMEVFRTVAPVALASVPLYAPVVAILSFAYQDLSPWIVVLFFVPALAAQRSFVMYQRQRRLTDELSSANGRLERANLSFAIALVATLDARDRYTAGHSEAVAIYSRDIAVRMGLDEEQQQLAHLCGLVHDIGKVGLPAGLLEKPGPLTLEERRQMEKHSAIGERILANVDDYSVIASVVRHHHERVDGRGYPDGLSSVEIPLLARIIAVADAYDAMTSDRPYRDAMPSQVARLRLAQAVESQFDTSVVAAFEAVLAGASEEYRSGSRPKFNRAPTLRLLDETPFSVRGEVAGAA